MRGKCADCNGGVAGRREGKRAQLGLGSEGTPGSRDGESANRQRADRTTNELGGVTSPASATEMGLGSCVEEERPGRERDRGTGACEGKPAALSLFDRAADMRKLTERQSTPTEGSRHSRRGWESRAQSVDRVTQREGALSLLGRPFGEQRSILGGRSRVWDGPSRFLGRETLEKPETEPSITEDRSRWQRKRTPSSESLSAMRQQ